MSKRNRGNIREYHRRPRTLNIGVIVFAIIFIYLGVTVYLYLSKDNISIYQVTEECSLAKNTEYTGIILRDEQLVTSDCAGYIRYYLRSGEHAGRGDLIYSIDESGDITKELAKGTISDTLKKMDLTGLKTRITAFVYNFSPSDFEKLYDFKTEMAYSVLELMNYNNAAYLTELLATVEADGLFRLYYTDASGTVAYYTDGYETLTPEMVKPDNLKKASYSRNVLNSTDFVEKDSPVYKLIQNNNWKVVFLLNDEDYSRYSELSSLTVTFTDYKLTLTAPFTILRNDTGSYGCLSFDRYMPHFIDARYLDFEILYKDDSGLKVPVSSVIEKDFYIIPSEYRFSSQGSYGFYLETSDANGNSIVEFVEPTVYNATETHYYVDTAAFAEGSYLINITTNERFRIGPKAALSGVYNVNKGYTVFRRIEVLDKNTEYYIVKSGTSYGISLYDHIILNGKTVKEGQTIYR